LQAAPLGDFQRRQLRLYQAQLAQALGRHARAVQWLRADLAAATAVDATVTGTTTGTGTTTDTVTTATVTDTTTVDLALRLRLLADSQQALNRNTDALATLLIRDALPPPDRMANQARIMALVDSLDALARLLMRESPPHPALPGWLALNDILRAAKPADRADAIHAWRARYPAHPARQFVADQGLAADDSAAPRYRHIALLLPLTSAFGRAAQAFYEGFLAAHAADADGPVITLHDLGADAELVGFYYRAARAAGADFVVGPLGRQAVGALLAGPPPELPVLVIGDVPAAQAAPNLFGLSLSPQREAAQVAARAFFRGHRQAGILAGDSADARRAAAAFADAWRSLGGRVVASRAVPREVADYARATQTLLGIDRSFAREKILSAQLDTRLEFNPRRRDDLDFLFLAASPADARLFAPHLRFYQAHDLPLYAASMVYGGAPNPAADADLDGIIFGDLAWTIDAAGAPVTASVSTAATVADATVTPAARPYFHTDLERIYALGLESYRLIPKLQALRGRAWAVHYGEAVDLSVGHDGNARRHLTWARFEFGLPLRLPGATAGVPIGTVTSRGR